MKQVDFLETQDDGSQTVLFTVKLTSPGRFLVSGDRQAAQRLGVPNKPVLAYNELIGPDRPGEYLAALRFAFTGSRIQATEVRDGEFDGQ